MAALVFVGLRIAICFISRIAFASMLYNFAILRSKILKFGAAKDLEIRYGKAILNFKYFIKGQNAPNFYMSRGFDDRLR